MIRLEDIAPAIYLTGLEPTNVYSIAAVVSLGDEALQVIYELNASV